ncbi:(E2-independent) E3 ubiquitin-conjugating enzyme FATS isoform X4 [Haplochromis burtoni]|uniref:(E2-independent) E3 ubiquitin-conjugating enzyme FATS isoform X4 n=1 Tax=Haplochromis burtoni TaxID=8153 RepID=UPI0003BC6AD1|nr:(E2-independent) E3 ubiquitin-conjugating enzyme FATS isoform X4 [Haplochromis burtoni]
MTLRRPAAHLRRTPGWRRSGDESYWESLMSEGPAVSHPPRAPRPQSAIEGGQLDSWLEHLQAMQSKLKAPAHNQARGFNDRTTSMPVLNKEPTGRAWRHTGFPSFSRVSSSCESSSLCDSSLGSQEFLQTGVFSPPERRGSWERAHIMQAPEKEQAELSYLSPVKIGWLPIQRRVMMVADTCNQNQFLDHAPGHLKLKQPITPTFQKNQATPKAQNAEVERSHATATALGVKTWQTPDQGAPVIKQVPEKPSFPANEGDRPVGWQALRRGWNTNRVSAFPGGSKTIELPTGTNSDPNRKSLLMKTASTEALRHPLLNRTTSATGNSPQPSDIQTNSAVGIFIPQNKPGFSSITISSRKVSRTASLPGSDTSNHSSQSRESPSPHNSLDHQPMDPNSRHLTVQRKATIVKVTEKRVISSPVSNTNTARTPPGSNGLDTVVHRRKATIIKVTEHRESYSPGRLRAKHPEYRHSYSEGTYMGNNTWSQENHSQNNEQPSYRHLNFIPNSAAPNTYTSDPEKNGSRHRSTLSLFLNNPPGVAAPTSSEISPKPVGQRSGRLHRPLSWYGNVIGHTETSKENLTQPSARKWSAGLPKETDINPLNSDNSFISPGKAVKRPGQLVAETLKSKAGEKERLPLPKSTLQAESSSLTLIKAPVTDEGERAKQHPNHSRRLNRPHAEFVPLSLDAEQSSEAVSLQDALQRSRPDFISRSQGRVRELERKAQERRKLSNSVGPQLEKAPRQRRALSTGSTSLNGNLFTHRERAFSRKDMQPRSKLTPADLKRQKEEERREVSLNNRYRAELYKKKLLDQLLQRSNN